MSAAEGDVEALRGLGVQSSFRGNMTGPFSNPAGGAKDAAAAYTRALLDLLGDRDPMVVQAALADNLERAVAGLSETLLRTPEKPGKWSVVQVVQHLADSEIVYGYRIRMILASDTP